MNATPTVTSEGPFDGALVRAANLRYYEEQATPFANRTQSLALDEVYAPFLRLLAPGARILDAGCGTGRDSAAFMRLGYAVAAFDASSAMVGLAKNREHRRKD